MPSQVIIITYFNDKEPLSFMQNFMIYIELSL